MDKSIEDMYHYRCNDCGHTWYTSLLTAQCKDPMCLQKNLSEISPSPKCSYSDLEDVMAKKGEEWNKIMDKLGEPIRIRLSQWVRYLEDQIEKGG